MEPIKQTQEGYGDYMVESYINPMEITIDHAQAKSPMVIVGADTVIWLINALRRVLIAWTEEPKHLP